MNTIALTNPLHHAHRDLIKAWADGETIQTYSQMSKIWIDISEPSWKEKIKYRIKPKATIRYIQITHNGAFIMKTNADVKDNLKLYFNEDGNLFKAEVINKETV